MLNKELINGTGQLCSILFVLNDVAYLALENDHLVNRDRLIELGNFVACCLESLWANF